MGKEQELDDRSLTQEETIELEAKDKEEKGKASALTGKEPKTEEEKEEQKEEEKEVEKTAEAEKAQEMEARSLAEHSQEYAHFAENATSREEAVYFASQAKVMSEWAKERTVQRSGGGQYDASKVVMNEEAVRAVEDKIDMPKDTQEMAVEGDKKANHYTEENLHNTLSEAEREGAERQDTLQNTPQISVPEKQEANESSAIAASIRQGMSR